VSDVRGREAVEKRKKIFQSDFINFFKSGLADLTLSLYECQTHVPVPLFAEMIFIYSVKGERRKALTILLNEIGDVSLAVDLIEDQFDSGIMLALEDSGSSKRTGQRFTSSSMPVGSLSPTSFSSVDHQISFSPLNIASPISSVELWNDLFRYVLEHVESLPELLDNLGVSRVDSEKVMKIIPPQLMIPHLRKRMLKMLQELKFKEEIFLFSKGICEDDALSLLCQKNNGQRRAIKIDSKQIRCSACLRPLSLDPALGSSTCNYNQLSHLLPCEKSEIQIWGPKRGEISSVGSLSSSTVGKRLSQYSGRQDTSAIVFSNKVAFHRVCYEKIPN
jgi:hypothetical protein